MKGLICEKNVLLFVKGRETASFVELQHQFGEGNGVITLGKDPNIILWNGLPEELIKVLNKLLEAERIKLVKTSPLVYALDGGQAPLKVAKRKSGYKTPHWLPVVVSPNEEITPEEIKEIRSETTMCQKQQRTYWSFAKCWDSCEFDGTCVKKEAHEKYMDKLGLKLSESHPKTKTWIIGPKYYSQNFVDFIGDINVISYGDYKLCTERAITGFGSVEEWARVYELERYDINIDDILDLFDETQCAKIFKEENYIEYDHQNMIYLQNEIRARIG